MENSNKKNKADCKDILLDYNKVLNLRGNVGQSFLENYKTESKEIISRYYFFAQSPQGGFHGSNQTGHRLAITMKKHWVREVYLGLENAREKTIKFKGMILVFWMYEGDPLTVESMLVDNTKEAKIKKVALQLNGIEYEKMMTMLQLLYTPLIGSSEPFAALSDVTMTKLLEGQAENGHE